MREVKSRRSYRIGLRRVWLVLSGLWLAASIAMTFDRGLVDFLLLGVIPVAVLFVITEGLAWIIEGFAKSD
jgi:hypothetical protein